MPIDFGKLTDKIVKRVVDNLEGSNPEIKDAGERVSETLVDGIEKGLEDATERIAASSVKITKAFKDLAKKVTNQKDVLNVSLGSKNVVIDIDFSDIEIDSDEIQKKINDTFEKIKIDGGIEFDTKAAEKHFKDMLGLRIKYAAKLERLQNSSRKITTSHARGVNAQEQLAVMAAIGEVDDSIRSVMSGGRSIRLPKVYFESIEVLRDRAELVELNIKREEIATKKAETAQKAYAKKNKKLERENELLRERNKLLGGNGSAGDAELEPKHKSSGKRKTPKSELPNVVETQDNNAFKQRQKDVESASKAFSNAERRLLNVIDAEKKLDEQLNNHNFVDYFKKYQDATELRKQLLDDLPRSLAKKKDHQSNVQFIEGIIQHLIDNGALGAVGQFSSPKDLRQFGQYRLAVSAGARNNTLNDSLNDLVKELTREVNETIDTYKSWGNIQSSDNPEADTLLEERRRLAKEHEAAVKAYNDAADAQATAVKAQAEFNDTKAQEATTGDADEQKRMAEEAAAKKAEEARLAKEQEEAERRALELAKQKAEEEARITAEKERQLAAENHYYPINEDAAKRAKEANSYNEYVPGSATAEYRRQVDEAKRLADEQKTKVDSMYHEKIDQLFDTYARKLAANMNESFDIEARMPSFLITGGGNFNVGKKQKQNAARDRNMEEWNSIRGLLDKIKGVGTGGISADDDQAVDKLEAKLKSLIEYQQLMKDVNAHFRKHGNLDDFEGLSKVAKEQLMMNMESPWHIDKSKPFQSYQLQNNSAEIRRVKDRIEELKKHEVQEYPEWEFEGGYVKANKDINRIQIFFDGKPAEDVRGQMKSGGFKWSPKEGAWQRQLNDNAYRAMGNIDAIQPGTGETPYDMLRKARAEQNRMADEAANLARQKAEEDALNAEMEAAVAEAMEEELKVEQEELKVEKEITKEYEKQYGYHSGKLSTDGHKAESLFNSQPGRDTGYYGTGFYATDKAHLGEIMSGQYGRKPLSVVDPDGYNLFDATNDKTAGQLHQFLKRITYKAFGKKGENIKSLYAEFKKLFPAEQILTYEDFKTLIGELQQYVKEYGDKYPLNTRMDSVSTKFMKNFGYEGVDVRGTKYADTTYGMVIYDLKEESIVLKEITDEMQKQEIAAGNIASVIENQVRTQERSNANEISQNQADQTKNVVKLVDNYGESLDEVNNKLMQGAKWLDEQGRIIRLFHNSDELFDEFDTAKSGNRQGVGTLGPGNYLHFGEGGKFDNAKYGRYQTQWYANLDKVFDAENDELSPDQISDLIDKFLPGLSENDKKNYTNKFGKKYMAQAVRYVAQKANADLADVWKHLGYDAVRRGDEINIFDSSKIHRANGSVLDMGKPNDAKEAQDLNLVAEAAEKAADSKQKLAEANKEVSASTSFSTRDYERLYDEMEAFAEQRKAENGYDLSRVTVNTDAHGNPLGATIAYYKKATKESIVETFKLDEAAQEAEEGVNRLVLSSRKATSGIADFEKATLQAINRQDQLMAQKNKTISSLSAVLDPNANKTLAGTEYEAEVNQRIQAIKDEVLKLDQVDSVGERIILPEKDYLAIKRRIAELTQDAHDFIEASKRAKYGRDQFEAHTVDSQVAYRKTNLEADISKWKRLGIYAGDLQAKAEELYQAVGQIKEPTDLKKYLEGLKEARALAQLATQDNKAEAEKQKPIIERQKQEQSYSDWWNKALLTREQQEKAKDERIIAARKRKEQAYVSWWEKTLKMQEVATQKEAEKQVNKDKQKAKLLYLNYGKTTANAAQRKQGDLHGAINSLEVTNPKVLAKIDEYNAKVKRVLDLRAQFANDPKAAQDPKLVKQFQKASYEAEQLRRGIKGIIDEEQRMIQMSLEQGFDPMELSVDQLANLKNEMIEFAKVGAQGRVEIKGWSADNTKMYYTVIDSKGAVQEMTAALGQGTNQLYKMRTATKETGTLFQQIFKGITVKAKELISYVIGGGSVYKVISMLRQGIQYVRDIDIALTELKKVTDETEESYDKFLNTAAKTADKVGSTIKDVVSSTADWARLGYSMEQAAKFAETTQILMNVSEFTDVSRATDTLISAVQAFGYTADTSMEVVDLLNTIGNNYAISTADLAQSLTKSSASLVAAGGDLAEAAALTATANKIIQDADSVGTALKTTSLRLRGTDVKVLEEEGLDSEGAVSSKSKLRSKVKALSGIDILTATGEYKSTYEILRDIADVWESISDMDQAALLELISGKRNSSVIAAILQNPEELKQAFEDANNASGSALKENEKYLDSIQGKIDQFNNAVQTMWSNTLDSDVVKWVVNLGTELIKIVDTLGLIPSILLSIASFKVLKSIFAGADIAGFIKSVSALTMGTKVFEAETIKASFALMGEAINTKLASTALVDYAVKMGLATSADVAKMTTGQLLWLNFKGLTTAIWGATKAVAAFLFTNPIGWLILAIGAIVGGIAAWNEWGDTTENLREKLDDLKGEVSDLQSELESLNSELETTRDRMDELLAKGTLSFTEQEELKNLQLQNELLEKRIKLQELLLKNKTKEYNRQAEDSINAEWNGTKFDKKYAISYYDGGSTNGGAAIIKEDGFWTSGVSGKEALDTSIDSYSKRRAQAAIEDDLYLRMLEEMAENDGQLSKSLIADIEKTLGYSQDYFNDQYGNVLVDGFYNDVASAKNVATHIKSSLEGSRNINTQALRDQETGIEMVLGDLLEVIPEDYNYGTSDIIDQAYDELMAYQLKYRQAQGEYVKSEAVSSMFGLTSSKEMQTLGKELQAIMSDDSITDKNQAILDKIGGLDGTNDAVIEVDKLSDAYSRLKTTMDIVGVTAQDIADYFVLESGSFDSSTVEGITNQYQKGVDVLQKYKEYGEDVNATLGTWLNSATGELENITWDSLFKDGEVVEIQIDKLLQGADETARKEFARIAKAVNEGEMEVETAMRSFGLSGTLAGFKLVEESIKELNTDVFKNLGDDISGLIDTFEELGSVLDSVAGSMDLISQAEAEQAYSGNVSLETALKLMQTTNDWNKILTITEGSIKVNENATEELVKDQLNLVVANLKTSLSTVSAQIAQNNMAASSDNLGKTIEESTTESVRQLAANMEYLSSLVGDFISGNWFADENGYTMAQRATNAKNASLESTKVADTPKTEVNLGEQQANLVAQLNMMGITATIDENGNVTYDGDVDWEKIMSGFSSDDASGGADDPDEVVENLFQREMDYWENRIAANQAKRDQIQNEIDLLESQGIRAGEEYYKELIALEEERKELLIAQRNEALAYLSTQEEGSEEWWNAASIVNDLEGEIDDATASIQDFADAQAQIKWDNLEEITSRFSNLHDEISDLRDILQREDMFDEDGNWTEAGAAVLGTYVQDLEMYKNELATLQSEIADLQAHPYNEENAAYLKETYSIDSEQEYNDLVTQWNQAQRDLVKGAYDTADAIKDAYSQQVDAIEDAINEQIDAYNDYIDVVKEAYDAERELYEFKKDIQKQSKSIAETERRIASLSGSTNAADIAERRKLEAQLAEQRESINDSYYSHANEQLNNALDNEAQAYEESMNRYVEGLRETLEEQAQGLIEFNETGAMVTNEFLNGVTATVLENAGIILDKYEEVSPYMSDELKQPWIDASAQLGEYGNDLSVLNEWTSDSGYFGKFETTASGQMTTPFINGSAAVSMFQTSVTNEMNTIASNVRSNVTNITSSLGSVESAYSGIITTANRAKAAIDAANAAAAANSNYTGTVGNSQNTVVGPQAVDNRILSKYKLTASQVLALGYGPISLEKFEELLRNYLIKYSNTFSKAQVWNTTLFERSIKSFGVNYVSGPMAIGQYAKGTIGTKRNEWAITDEPQYGDELVLVPGKDGNLSFMRKGTSVVPADLAANLMEWGQFSPESLNLGGGVNVNMINNAVIKPQYDFNFDSLVHVDNCSQETLKDLEKMVDNKIDRFSKELNYSIKRFAR